MAIYFYLDFLLFLPTILIILSPLQCHHNIIQFRKFIFKELFYFIHSVLINSN